MLVGGEVADALSRGKSPAQAELGRGTLVSKMNATVWASPSGE